MIPNKWVIFWNNQPIGLDRDSGGYPYKTENPNWIKYWDSKEKANRYIEVIMTSYPNLIVKEIQFRIMDK